MSPRPWSVWEGFGAIEDIVATGFKFGTSAEEMVADIEEQLAAIKERLKELATA